MAGASGLADFAVDPLSKGDNYSRHMTRALDLESLDKHLYFVNTTVYDKKKRRAVPQEVPMRLPLDIIQRLFLRDPRAINPLANDAADWDVPVFRGHCRVHVFKPRPSVC